MKISMLHFFATPRRCARATMLVFSVVIGVASISVVAAGATRIDAHFRRVTSVSFIGHGWGSGIGLGQWGAFGYAVRYHFGYERILNHFYGETESAMLASTGQPANPTISVAILENMDLSTNIGYDPVVTASTPFTVTSSGGSPVVPTTSTTTTTTSSTTTTLPATTTTTVAPTTTTAVTPTTAAPAPMSFVVPAGTAIDFVLGADGTWNAFEGSSCASASAATSSTAPIATGLVNPVVSPSVADSASVSKLLVLCRHDGVNESLHGSIEAYDRSGYERTLSLVPLETYLQGVVPAESSASWGSDGTTTNAPLGRPWGFQALEAQAVAARSYAMSYVESGGWNQYAGICDTTQCQVYAGANFEDPVSTAAVEATAGEIRIRPSAPTEVVSTRFSASTGGYTAAGDFPPVHDLGDACVVPSDPLECNPNHTWETTVSGRQITQHFRSIGRLLFIHVSLRSGYGAFGGRAVTVLLRGSRSVLRVPAAEFVSALGLRSDWFAISGETRFGRMSTSTSTTTPGTTTTTTTPGTTTTTTATTTTTSSTPTTTSSSSTTTTTPAG